MRIRVCWYKNAGVAGYAEAFRPVQSDSQTSEWYSYFENDVLDCLRQWNFGLYVSGFWHIPVSYTHLVSQVSKCRCKSETVAMPPVEHILRIADIPV